MARYLPRLVTAALRGGAGKTTLSLGMIAAWKRLGRNGAAFKKGPDFIDSAWLSLAAQRPCRNLDTFLLGPKRVQQSFGRNAESRGISLIEGNRGLYDGMDSRGTQSTAELAKLLNAPVVLVLDCSKVTRTLAAMVLGWSLCEDARYQQASHSAEVGDFDAAETVLRSLQSSEARAIGQAVLENDLGAIAAARGDWDTARVRFRQALDFDQNCEAARLNLLTLASADEHRILNDTGSNGTSGRHPMGDAPRVAILSLLFNWPSTGGGTVHTAELGKFLARSAYDDVKEARVKIFVPHAPPYGTKLDIIHAGFHVGSTAVREFVEDHPVDAVVCGHIHEARGIDAIDTTRILNCGLAGHGHYGFVDTGDEGRQLFEASA